MNIFQSVPRLARDFPWARGEALSPRKNADLAWVVERVIHLQLKIHTRFSVSGLDLLDVPIGDYGSADSKGNISVHWIYYTRYDLWTKSVAGPALHI